MDYGRWYWASLRYRIFCIVFFVCKMQWLSHRAGHMCFVKAEATSCKSRCRGGELRKKNDQGRLKLEFLILWMDEIRRSPLEVGCFSHYLQGFIHPKWCKISSINSISCADPSSNGSKERYCQRLRGSQRIIYYSFFKSRPVSRVHFFLELGWKEQEA